MTILGTRPEIIRLSRIIPKLDQLASRHILVHTGQNYHPKLGDVFFHQLKLRKPDYWLQLNASSFGVQIGSLFPQIEQIMRQEQPDHILILGDTNSALCAVLGERLGIPVYHMEAGNRCFDPLVPEELNRRIVDTASAFNLPYTRGARDNLLREGIPPSRIWVTGNPIFEVMDFYKQEIDACDILDRMQLEQKKFVLVTAHRSENVDQESNLMSIIEGLKLIGDDLQLPIICSVHPRTRAKLNLFGIAPDHPYIRLCEPFPFFEFMKLQGSAACVITDSGTVQEESCILGVPGVIIRRSTERPETVLCGASIISGLQSQRIYECAKLMMKRSVPWAMPEGYLERNVSSKVLNMVLGGLHHV